MATPPLSVHSVVAPGYDALAEAYLRLGECNGWGPRLRYLERLEARLPSGGLVLDVGCGAGLPVTRLLTERHIVLAVDVSPVSVGLARRNAPGADVRLCDVLTLDLPAASLDAVVALYTLTHVPRAALAGLLARMTSWLRPGGLLLASLGAGDHPDEVCDDFLGLGAPMFVSHYDAVTNTRIVRAAGFDVEAADVVAQEEDGRVVEFLWVLARRRRDGRDAAQSDDGDGRDAAQSDVPGGTASNRPQPLQRRGERHGVDQVVHDEGHPAHEAGAAGAAVDGAVAVAGPGQVQRRAGVESESDDLVLDEIPDRCDDPRPGQGAEAARRVHRLHELLGVVGKGAPLLEVRAERDVREALGVGDRARAGDHEHVPRRHPLVRQLGARLRGGELGARRREAAAPESAEPVNRHVAHGAAQRLGDVGDGALLPRLRVAAVPEVQQGDLPPLPEEQGGGDRAVQPAAGHDERSPARRRRVERAAAHLAALAVDVHRRVRREVLHARLAEVEQPVGGRRDELLRGRRERDRRQQGGTGQDQRLEVLRQVHHPRLGRVDGGQRVGALHAAQPAVEAVGGEQQRQHGGVDRQPVDAEPSPQLVVVGDGAVVHHRPAAGVERLRGRLAQLGVPLRRRNRPAARERHGQLRGDDAAQVGGGRRGGALPAPEAAVASDGGHAEAVAAAHGAAQDEAGQLPAGGDRVDAPRAEDHEAGDGAHAGTPPVSVVVATRGRIAAVASLLATLRTAATTYPGDVEIILADATAPQDAAALRRLAALSGARVVHGEAGVARQRNRGWQAARHPVVHFVDSDCRVPPDLLVRAAAHLHAGDAVAVAGRVRFTGARSRMLDAAEATGVTAGFDGFDGGPDVPWGVTANLAVHRAALAAVGGFDEAFPSAEDVDVGLRLRRLGPIRFVPAAVVQHDTATWRGAPATFRRFFVYGRGDAHLLRRHPQLAGPAGAPLLPVLVLAGSPLLAGEALLVAAIAHLAAARGRLDETIGFGLLQVLAAGRQVEALRLRCLRALRHGVVLDEGQQERERAARRRAWLACGAGAAWVAARRSAWPRS